MSDVHRERKGALMAAHALHDPSTAQRLAEIRAALERPEKELRGLQAALGPERGAMVAELLALSRRCVIDGIWVQWSGVRLRMHGQMDTSATILWDRLPRWLESARKKDLEYRAKLGLSSDRRND